MADKIHLSVISADGLKLDRMVSYVLIPAETGSVGVLADHLPMLCAVKHDVMKCWSEQKEEVSLEVRDGIASVSGNEVTFLVADAKEVNRTM